MPSPPLLGVRHLGVAARPDAGVHGMDRRAVAQRLGGELANCCCPDLTTLALALRRAKARLRHKRAVIQACFTPAGYHV